MDANIMVENFRNEFGREVANRAVKIHNKARKNDTPVAELRAAAKADPSEIGAIAFRCAADLLTVTTPRLV